MKRITIIGISGKLGQYMTEHALSRGYAVTGVCRPESVDKLARFGKRINVIPGSTSDPEVLRKAMQEADGVLTVLVPWGRDRMATRMAEAVLKYAKPDARLIFSCGWHVRLEDADRYPLKERIMSWIFGRIAKLTQIADIDDQEVAAQLVFGSDRDWTIVRASDLEEGETEGLPVWAANVGDPILASNRTRRTDFALFMVHALTDASLSQKAPAIVSRAAQSARDHRQATLLTTHT
ncbi:MAG: NAD(P)-dependent oxidoreductase [Yoonia sp.]|uniref:NAD(P)-dependent oxidoreductase n=1 Tax=Yoonia sp. TaxID=2212373 RepID=UPI003EFAAB01